MVLEKSLWREIAAPIAATNRTMSAKDQIAIVQAVDALGLPNVQLRVINFGSTQVVTVQTPFCELPSLKIHRDTRPMDTLAKEIIRAINYLVSPITPYDEVDIHALEAVTTAATLKKLNHKTVFLLPPAIKFEVGRTDNIFGDIGNGVIFAGRIWTPPTMHQLIDSNCPERIRFGMKLMLPGHTDWKRRQIVHYTR